MGHAHFAKGSYRRKTGVTAARAADVGKFAPWSAPPRLKVLAECRL